MGSELLVACPHCRQEVRPDYRFCQHCGFKLWQTWNGSNLSRLFEGVEAGKNVHRLAQNKLWKIGKDLGFHSITDFVPQNTVLQSRGDLIDVVWKTENEVEFAFEIRAKAHDLDRLSSHREDIVKLHNLEAKKKFFVNVSNKSGKAFFNEIPDESVERLEGRKVGETSLVTFLVKSEKNGKICLACVDQDRFWVRPIKPGGFEEKDIVMDNGKMIALFDVVEMKFGAHFPIKHQSENMLFDSGTSIRFVTNLDEDTRKSLLSEYANTRILDTVSSREELYDELALNLEQSLVLVGPVNLFEIQCNIISGKTHPRIWIVRPNDKQRVFSITCTDIKFCRFIGSKIADLEQDDGVISSQDIVELKDKQTYFVIGLTGDSLDENNEIRDGRYAPPGSSIQPRYWPLVVSVLTVPDYSCED